jgi:hypothetical protein
LQRNLALEISVANIIMADDNRRVTISVAKIISIIHLPFHTFFLAGFYSRDFILEMFSMRYVNIFGFFLLFLSTGLTVCRKIT